jgi:hypothetical protein
MTFSLKEHLVDALIAVAQNMHQECLGRALRNKDESAIRRLINRVPVEWLTAPAFKNNLGRLVPASFKRTLSSRSLLAVQSERACGKQLPEWRLNHKATGFRFADALRVHRPALLISGRRMVDLDLQPNSVVKPASGAGSVGVYIIGVDRIRDVKHARELSSLEELRDRMAENLKSGVVKADAWNVEAYISTVTGEPARDIKFYSFYGEVVLVLEVRRTPKVEYCWWLADGRPLNLSGIEDVAGKYSGRLFSGDGFKPAWRELAERISLEIPTPFCRIDFLSSGDDVFFGEFTPRPGGFDKFAQPYDQLLGEAFLSAEARLLRDLVGGKIFTTFNSL